MSSSSEVATAFAPLVDELNGRIYTLEQRICGQVGILQQQQTIIDSLVAVNNQISELTAGRERFHQVNLQLEQLENVLSHPEVLDLEYEEEANVQLVLLEENRLKHEALLYQEIDKLKSVLDSDNLRNHQELVPKLANIRALVIKQSKDAEKIAAESRELVLYHHKLTETINTLLTAFDKKLKELERAKKASPRGR